MLNKCYAKKGNNSPRRPAAFPLKKPVLFFLFGYSLSMGRGADETTGGQAPPRRNPFRQEISENNHSSGTSQGTGLGWQEEAKQEGYDLAGKIQDHLLSYFDDSPWNADISSEPPDPRWQYDVDVREERFLKPVASSRYENAEDAVSLEMKMKKHNSKILNVISSILSSYAGDDLDLASELEALLASEGEGFFHLEKGHFNDSTYWYHDLNIAALDRFLRNMQRTILIYRRDQVATEDSKNQEYMEQETKESQEESPDDAAALKEAEAEALREAQERQREAEYTAYRIENF